jgi:hypothetical protein
MGKTFNRVNHPFCLGGMNEKQLRGNPAWIVVMAVPDRVGLRSRPGWPIHQVSASAGSDETQLPQPQNPSAALSLHKFPFLKVSSCFGLRDVSKTSLNTSTHMSFGLLLFEDIA